jgi:hypothetical protein
MVICRSGCKQKTTEASCNAVPNKLCKYIKSNKTRKNKNGEDVPYKSYCTMNRAAYMLDQTHCKHIRKRRTPGERVRTSAVRFAPVELSASQVPSVVSSVASVSPAPGSASPAPGSASPTPSPPAAVQPPKKKRKTQAERLAEEAAIYQGYKKGGRHTTRNRKKSGRFTKRK